MKASLAVSKYFQQNKIFAAGSRDNCNERFTRLRYLLREQGIDLSTEDINPLNRDSAIHIHLDAEPKKLRKSKKSEAYSILVISESPIICTANHKGVIRGLADKIFTWETDAKESHASWLGCGCSFEAKLENQATEEKNRKKDLCMIIGNKSSALKNELYSRRRDAIEYFTHSNIDFDLYGTGWEGRRFCGVLRPLNKISIARQWNYSLPGSYKGEVDSKIKVLQSYKFTLAFENAKSCNGYISEKIFDAMACGTIPIYVGASNVTDFLPESTYINGNGMSFRDMEQAILGMSESEYKSRVQSIKKYITQFHKTSFYFDYWAKEIVNHISQLKI